NLYNDTEYSYISPNFVSEPGFINRTDIGRIENFTNYRFHPEGKYVIAWGPNVMVSRAWDHNGTVIDSRVQSEFDVYFKQQTNVGYVFNYATETLRPVDFATLTGNRDYSHYSSGLFANISRWKKVGFSAKYGWDTRINYVPPNGQAPALANGNTAGLSVTWRPDSRLMVDNGYTFSRIRSQADGAALFNDHIVRSKWNWQFNRELSLRFIAQYDSLLANPYLTSLQPAKKFNVDLLATYLLHPGTAIYVGYNSNLQNLDPALRTDASGYLLRTRNGFINDGRQFFVKISYLLRF
ncbi:MAG TPA: hypothetical protein VFM10_09295, partial [Terriglobales bacterium]|nr:hypothetical protein [Terriglobales bacterium]